MFKSQNEASRLAGRARTMASITVTQSYKKSTNTEEMSFRIASRILTKIGIEIGDRVDVLFDSETVKWMIQKNPQGFKVSGRPGGPNGLVRYTLKPKHIKLTSKQHDLPMKMESDESSIAIGDNFVVFKLKA